LWQVVAEKVSADWNARGNCMLVVGATYPDELRAVRALVGEMTLLIPGVGAQGGEVESVVRSGVNAAGRGMIVTVSRAILHADDPGAAAKQYRDDINRYR
jgi:orotidine-5'-phosphate decarboxylase